MNIYDNYDYRDLLTKVVAERKQLDPSINFQQMSAHIRVPKSYMSRVIHGKADLSTDQMFLVCDYLNFIEAEADYMQLLLEHERCSIHRRKLLLQQKIKAIQSQHLDTKTHLTEAEISPETGVYNDYYLDPLHQLVHAALAIPKYNKSPQELTSSMGVPTNRLQKILTNLERMKIIKRSETGIVILVENLHLPKDSSLYRSWRNHLKIQSLNQIDQSPENETYSFSVIFSGDETTRAKIQREFLRFLSSTEKLVGASKQEKVYQLSFELFPWL